MEILKYMSKIEGKAIYLRKFEPIHLNDPNYFNWLKDVDVMKYIGREEYLNDISFEEVEDYVNKIWEDRYSVFFAVHDKKTNNFIGTTKINYVNELGFSTKTADIGIMIGDKSFWGKGIAKDVLYTISCYCFEILNLRKLTAGALDANIAVIKAFDRIGYKREALMREKIIIQNKYYDQILFGCFNNELKTIY